MKIEKLDETTDLEGKTIIVINTGSIKKDLSFKN